MQQTMTVKQAEAKFGNLWHSKMSVVKTPMAFTDEGGSRWVPVLDIVANSPALVGYRRLEDSNGTV